MNEKHLLTSRTFWFGAATFTVSALEFLNGNEFIKQYPGLVSAIGASLGVATIVLRLLTSSSVSVKADKTDK